MYDKIILDALDLYVRVGLGQIDHVRDVLNRLYPDQAYWPADSIKQDFDALGKKLHCSGYGIHNPAVPQRVRDALNLLNNLIESDAKEASWDQKNQQWWEGKLTLGEAYGASCPETHRHVTRTHCFVMRHWQLSKKPAYTIGKLNPDGTVDLGGSGGWSGYYSNTVSLLRLPEPHDPSEHYTYKKDKHE